MARRAGSDSGDRADAKGFEAIADELYALPPSEFTAARDARAARARRDGDRGLATRVKALRRPTLAAWASNVLVRAHPDRVRGLLELGEELRRAHQDLDGTRLRALSVRHRALTTALAGQARELAGKAGQPLSDQATLEVGGTLQAALADPESAAAWASGRLAHALLPPAFPFAATDAAAPAVPSAGAGAGARAGARRRTGPSPGPAPVEPGDSKPAQARREARAQAVAARRSAEEAAAAVAEAEAALEQARNRSRDTQKRKRQAREHLAELRRKVADAEQAEQDAAEDEQRAHDEVGQAERGLPGARRHAREAAAHAERLARRADGDHTGTTTAARGRTENRPRGRSRGGSQGRSRGRR
ncbi:hypothetical protein [Embleya sp. NPDC005575]|uniref:hypothetical protein n=1 Tax=Embleya sp. NPDC005575 TaxID=3156892 RepID=UPI0033A38B12